DGKVPALARSLHSRTRVARTLIDWARRGARLPGVSLRPVEVNGGPGALYLDPQRRLIAVVTLEIAGGQITSIHAVLTPHHPPAPLPPPPLPPGRASRARAPAALPPRRCSRPRFRRARPGTCCGAQCAPTTPWRLGQDPCETSRFDFP